MLSSPWDCEASESGRRSVSLTPGAPGFSVAPGARGCVPSECVPAHVMDVHTPQALLLLITGTGVSPFLWASPLH